MARGSDAEQCEAPFQESLVREAFHVSLQIVVPFYLHASSAVFVAVADGPGRRNHVFVEGFGVVADFLGVQERFVREFDVFAYPLFEFDSEFFGHIRAVQHRPGGHRVSFRRPEDRCFLPGHAMDCVFSLVLFERSALSGIDEIASCDVRSVFLGDGGHLLEVMQGRLVVHVQEPEVLTFRHFFAVVLGASQSSGIGVFHGYGVGHLGCRLPCFGQGCVDAFA